MTGIFRKLNFTSQPAIYVENAPESFGPAMNDMRQVTAVHESLTGAKQEMFAMTFATKQVEVDRFASRVTKATSGVDAVVWVAYPKGTSKNYQCEFNRDNGWGKLGELGFEPVRQVAIDADWTALRFRRVEYIKKMIRGFALTEAGRAKASQRRTATP